MIPSFGLERDGQFPQQSVSLHLVVVVVELDSATGMLTVCLLVMMMHEKSSNAFMGAHLLMDRAHEYDRLDEAFLANLRLILIAIYLKKHSQNLHEDIFILRSPIITS